MGQTLCLELPWVVSLNPFTAAEAHPGRNFVSFSWQYPKGLEQCVAQRKNSVSMDCMRMAVKIDCVITLALWKRKLLLGDTRAQGICGSSDEESRKESGHRQSLSFTWGDFEVAKPGSARNEHLRQAARVLWSSEKSGHPIIREASQIKMLQWGPLSRLEEHPGLWPGQETPRQMFCTFFFKSNFRFMEQLIGKYRELPSIFSHPNPLHPVIINTPHY